MKSTEFFSGSGNLSRALSKQKFITTTIDKRHRKNICVPNLRLDLYVSKVPSPLLLNNHLFWFGLPCTAWSNASGNFHIDSKGNYNSILANESIKLLQKCLDLILEYKPTFWVFENPRGRLQSNKSMLQFLSKNNGKIYTFSMGSYGFPTQKPTQLFTNWGNLKLKNQMKYGRGAKSIGNFSNLTKNQRQSYPPDFCKAISTQILKAEVYQDLLLF